MRNFSFSIFFSTGHISSLIQSELGSLQINDFSLVQDVLRIFRFASKISNCRFTRIFSVQTILFVFNVNLGLMEYILNRANDEMSKKYDLCINSILLAKSISAKLWFDTPHIFRQFPRIGRRLPLFDETNVFKKINLGPATSQAFIDALYVTIDRIQTLTLFDIQTVIVLKFFFHRLFIILIL